MRGGTNDHLFILAERGLRWLVEQYRSQSARVLVNRARLAAAQLLMPPETVPPHRSPQASAPAPEPGTPHNRDGGAPDALAGMCAGITLRDLTLVDSLLAQLEDMEATEGDPDALALLYQLDHLAARMRRNAEKLRVLAGHDTDGAASAASALVDVIRAGMSSIEQYRRVEIGRVAPRAVVDLAADDVSRLLAELLDNATSHSPPDSKVTVSAHLSEQGNVLLRIEDTGTGLPADRLRTLNDQLSADLGRDGGSGAQMGFGVVRHAASKHGIRVRLDKRAPGGTTATVLLPVTVLCDAPATPWFAGPATAKVSPPPPVPVGVQASAATTRNGLPRRVPQSLREFASFASTGSAPGHDPDSDPNAGRQQMMADLGDFAEGERAARDDGSPRRTTAGDRAAGPLE